MSEHGTRHAYQQGCRCTHCRVANAAAVAQWRANPYADPWIDAGETRAKLTALEAHGCGTRQVAQLSGLSRSVLQSIRSGARLRIRQSDALLVLGLEATPAQGSITTAWQTKRWLRALLSEGYSRARLARLLGLRRGQLARHTQRVRRSTEQRTGELYRSLTAEGPELNSLNNG